MQQVKSIEELLADVQQLVDDLRVKLSAADEMKITFRDSHAVIESINAAILHDAARFKPIFAQLLTVLKNQPLPQGLLDQLQAPTKPSNNSAPPQGTPLKTKPIGMSPVIHGIINTMYQMYIKVGVEKPGLLDILENRYDDWPSVRFLGQETLYVLVAQDMHNSSASPYVVNTGVARPFKDAVKDAYDLLQKIQEGTVPAHLVPSKLVVMLSERIGDDLDKIKEVLESWGIFD